MWLQSPIQLLLKVTHLTLEELTVGASKAHGGSLGLVLYKFPSTFIAAVFGSP